MKLKNTVSLSKNITITFFFWGVFSSNKKIRLLIKIKDWWDIHGCSSRDHYKWIPQKLADTHSLNVLNRPQLLMFTWKFLSTYINISHKLYQILTGWRSLSFTNFFRRDFNIFDKVHTFWKSSSKITADLPWSGWRRGARTPVQSDSSISEGVDYKS